MRLPLARAFRSHSLCATEMRHLDPLQGLGSERPSSTRFAARMQRRSIGLWSPARVASLHSHAGRGWAEEAILAALVLVWARILAADGGCSRCRRESGVLRAEISTDALVIVSWMGS